MVVAALTGRRGGKYDQLAVPDQTVDQRAGAGLGQMFGHLQALDQAEAAPQIERLRKIMCVKTLGRKQQPAAIDIRSIHPEHIVHAVLLPHREPRALAAADIEHRRR